MHWHYRPLFAAGIQRTGGCRGNALPSPLGAVVSIGFVISAEKMSEGER